MRRAVVYICNECRRESPRWAGRCPECGSWNSLTETVSERRPRQAAAVGMTTSAEPVSLADLGVGDGRARLVLALSEFDRVLGGGIVPGSLILLGGDPGIGKSTLLLQAAALAARDGRKVLYISGEESVQQLGMRAKRLGIAQSGLYLLAETDLDAALAAADRLAPELALLVVDSIQTVYRPDLAPSPGSIVQLRECAMHLMRWAKGNGVAVVLVGHVTKEGEIAGPRLVEHIVDVVLYLEGERFSAYRVLRGVKNRFGSVSEIGVFEMTGDGLVPVENPSELFLAERPEVAVGSVVMPTVEGSRPLLVEVQALTSPTALAVPRRTGSGIDANRLVLIGAVLSRRAGLALANQDIIVNVVGGLRVQEPAADLAVAVAIASSFRDRPVAGDLVVVGEVGLSGELRSVPHLERRLAEAERLGFQRCLLPKAALRRGRLASGLEVTTASTLREALAAALG